MPLTMHGKWKMEITKAIHNWENRVVVAGAQSGNGAYPPDVGTVIEADGRPSWELRGEYRESASAAWQPSDMAVLERHVGGADLRYLIGCEDPLPSRDFEDVQLDAVHQGPMIEIPYRPYAVFTNNLFMAPDGVFETAVGLYYMGVRVTNTWGEALHKAHVLDISPAGRALLASQGVRVIDAWTDAELRALGQTMHGTGVVLGQLQPFESRTVHFKVDVTDALPHKVFVEFVCLDSTGTPDPDNPKRKATRAIFISRSHVDRPTGDIVSETPQGTLRMKLREVALDRAGARRARRRLPAGGPAGSHGGGKVPSVEELRSLLDAILKGKRVDICLLRRVIACYCECRDLFGGKDPRDHGSGDLPPRDGRFVYDPFYIFPTRFSFEVTPRSPYTGQFGPIPFQDPWWKVLLLIIAIILLIAGAVSEASDVAYHDEDLIIGQLGGWQQNDVDAAYCVLNGSRDVPDPLFQVLDAQTGEVNTSPVDALDGTVTITAGVMTKAEAQAALASADPTDREVFKSGARTGVTHGLITGISPWSAPRSDDGTVFSIDQLEVGQDPAFGMNVSQPGDSGSIWIHKKTRRLIALHHSGSDGPDTAYGSFLEDVMSALGITLG